VFRFAPLWQASSSWLSKQALLAISLLSLDDSDFERCVVRIISGILVW
jgi:hypothetical protein